MENIVEKIKQPKWRKTKIEVTKIFIERGNCMRKNFFSDSENQMRAKGQEFSKTIYLFEQWKIRIIFETE